MPILPCHTFYSAGWWFKSVKSRVPQVAEQLIVLFAYFRHDMVSIQIRRSQIGHRLLMAFMCFRSHSCQASALASRSPKEKLRLGLAARILKPVDLSIGQGSSILPLDHSTTMILITERLHKARPQMPAASWARRGLFELSRLAVKNVQYAPRLRTATSNLILCQLMKSFGNQMP